MPLTDDVIYGGILVLSVTFGHLVKNTKGPQKRQLLCTATGAGVIFLTVGFNILHSLVTTLITCLIIQLTGPKKCHIYSTIWCFGYLGFFRTCHYFGFPKAPPVSNAAQLFLTLRLTGLAYEIYDSYMTRKSEDLTKEEKEIRVKYQCINPSTIDILHYAYCYIGQFTGPYYRYRTYYDMIHNENTDNVPSIDPAIKRAKDLPLVIVSYLFFSYFFTIEYVKTDEFYLEPFWFRLFYMVPMFIVFRTRLYIAWVLSECMSMMATLGAYPKLSVPKCGKGPTDLKALDESLSKKENIEYDYETIHNLSIWGCELGPTTREGLRSWNMTVQYWLAAYCHHRIPRNLKAYRIAITMSVSAYWHGVFPGYYLSFLLVPVILLAEDAMIAAFRNGSEKRKEMFDWVCWFFKMRGFDYMCMGFLLLRLDYTLSYWSSIFFLGHVVTIVFLVTAKMFHKKSVKTDERKTS
ncbi:hypothetical protein FSP39_013739 [Pinctada imbricata]|uniref:Lysophospholipid acyltransferase 7 n=1 Tax=Pinctada imbricata TaxID=66713 RepID=A0AA89BPL5_PINIB|nr:hypothetical protein FSP39_013739 [Pinctada imbricata]